MTASRQRHDPRSSPMIQRSASPVAESKGITVTEAEIDQVTRAARSPEGRGIEQQIGSSRRSGALDRCARATSGATQLIAKRHDRVRRRQPTRPPIRGPVASAQADAGRRHREPALRHRGTAADSSSPAASISEPESARSGRRPLSRRSRAAVTRRSLVLSSPAPGRAGAAHRRAWRRPRGRPQSLVASADHPQLRSSRAAGIEPEAGGFRTPTALVAVRRPGRSSGLVAGRRRG